jgi:hypothetical protein
MFHKLKAVLAAVALAGGPSAYGATFFDTTGDNFDGNAHMDIASVDVTNDATNITFKISLNGSIGAGTDWGKYVIGINTNDATGDFGSPVGNPWGRNIAMANGTDAWVGSWVDSGGGVQPWTYSAGSWTQNGSGVPVLAANSTTITTSLASLGLTVGQLITFDVYTTGGGGGDSANDSVANPGQTITNWPGPYTTPGSGPGAALSYTIAVPEPTSICLLALGALAMAHGSRRRG